MNREVDMNEFEVGYDIPAAIGMDESEIQTPCLVIDLDAFEHNIEVMRAYIEEHGIRHRLHGKMHKSVDVANYQIEKGNACGVCCQKVSEAEVLYWYRTRFVILPRLIAWPDYQN
jgi:3-hydroxy-D-aspartate aldolase